MTYPSPREPRRPSKASYVGVGLIIVVGVIAAALYVLAISRDTETLPDASAPSRAENSPTGTAEPGMPPADGAGSNP